MALFRLKMTLFCIVVSMTAVACGKNQQKVLPKPSTAPTTPSESKSLSDIDVLKDPKCASSSSCPDVEFSVVDETGSVPGGKSASLKAVVAWKFKLQSKAITGRHVFFVRQVPIWATIKDSSEGLEKSIDGTASELTSEGKIIFSVRDMVKCKVNNIADTSVCINREKILPFDKEVVIKYTVR